MEVNRGAFVVALGVVVAVNAWSVVALLGSVGGSPTTATRDGAPSLVAAAPAAQAIPPAASSFLPAASPLASAPTLTPTPPLWTPTPASVAPALAPASSTADPDGDFGLTLRVLGRLGNTLGLGGSAPPAR